MLRQLLRCFLGLLFAGMLTGTLVGAENGRPSEAEWAPLAKAIEADGAAARDDLARFMRNRNWPRGWAVLAGLAQAAGDWKACVRASRTGLQQALAVEDERGADPEFIQTRADLAARLIVSLTRSGEHDLALGIMSKFGERADPDGRVHFHAAEAALAAEQVQRATTLIQQALAVERRASYLFRKGVLLEHLADEPGHVAADDLSEALASYRDAVELDPTLRAAWYNIGRLQHALHKRRPMQTDEDLVAADQAFAEALRLDEDDAAARLGQSLVRLDMGDLEEAYYGLRTVRDQFEKQGGVDRRLAQLLYRGMGGAQLQLAERDPYSWSHEEAFADLQRAYQLGDRSRDAINNLLVAAIIMQGRSDNEAGRAELAALVAELRQTGDVEPVNQAMATFRLAQAAAKHDDPPGVQRYASTSAALFADILGVEAEQIDAWAGADPDEREIALWRYLGHAWHLHAEALGKDEAPADAVVASRDRAAAAWAIAARSGDYLAQRHYLAQQSRRGGSYAYRAGWRYLAWRSYLSPAGWRTVIGSYGSAKAWRHPVHLAAWGLLLLLTLALGLRGKFGKRADEDDRNPGQRSTRRAPPKTDPRRAKTIKRQPPAPSKAQQGNEAAVGAESTLRPNTMLPGGKAPLQRRKQKAGEQRPPRGDKAGRSTEGSIETQRYDPSQIPRRPEKR